MLNLIHRGPLAPASVVRTYTILSRMTPEEVRAFDASMGMSRIEAHFQAGSAVSRAVRPVVSTMSRYADQPFRRVAVLHELRRRGIKSKAAVTQLVRDAVNDPDGKAMDTLVEAAGDARQHVLDFRSLGKTERDVISRIGFVYPFMKAGGRYAAEFPQRHPVLTGLMEPLGQEGEENALEGGPGYMDNWIDVGGGMVSNPQSIDPLSMGKEFLEVGGNLAGLDRGCPVARRT